MGLNKYVKQSIQLASKNLHFDIFAICGVKMSVFEKKKNFIQNRHNHHRPNIQHNRALEKMNIQHNRGLLRSRSNIWSGGAVKF